MQIGVTRDYWYLYILDSDYHSKHTVPDELVEEYFKSLAAFTSIQNKLNDHFKDNKEKVR